MIAPEGNPHGKWRNGALRSLHIPLTRADVDNPGTNSLFQDGSGEN